MVGCSQCPPSLSLHPRRLELTTQRGSESLTLLKEHTQNQVEPWPFWGITVAPHHLPSLLNFTSGFPVCKSNQAAACGQGAFPSAEGSVGPSRRRHPWDALMWERRRPALLLMRLSKVSAEGRGSWGVACLPIPDKQASVLVGVVYKGTHTRDKSFTFLFPQTKGALAGGCVYVQPGYFGRGSTSASITK